MVSQTKKVSFKLSKRLSRPFFDYDTGTEMISVLFDTGANIPIWCTGEALLLSAYPDAHRINQKQIVRGFGKNPESGEVFQIPVFELKDENTAYRLHNLQFIVLDRPEIGCDFLICPGMFAKSDYYVTNRGKKEITFVSDKEDYYFTPIHDSNGGIERYTVWEQDTRAL
ncbi:MAG: hypothetical protein IJR58_08120 [Lachnospiraceae bacterium]|nr:hypothetical protein [Lachnospiraceae bacterium]